MNIFISHNSKDKPQVEIFALAFKHAYGMGNVFYDSWSIQPGDGIIDKMNSGLSTCDFFIFFISNNSLTSKMVSLEWKNALMIESQDRMRFIPVKLDDCEVPALLSQKLYVDVPTLGKEKAIRQLLDVVQGRNTYREPEGSHMFNNLKAYARTAKENYRVDFEIRAIAQPELISRYCIVLKNSNAKVWCTSDQLQESGKGTIQADDGTPRYLYQITVSRATVPGFPMRIAITDNEAISIEGVFHAISEEDFEKVPIITVLSKEMFGFDSDIEVPLDDVVGTDKTQQEIYEYMAKKIADAQGIQADKE